MFHFQSILHLVLLLHPISILVGLIHVALLIVRSVSRSQIRYDLLKNKEIHLTVLLIKICRSALSRDLRPLLLFPPTRRPPDLRCCLDWL